MAAVALLYDFKQIVARLGIERFQAQVVEDEELDRAKRAEEAGIAPVAAC